MSIAEKSALVAPKIGARRRVQSRLGVLQRIAYVLRVWHKRMRDRRALAGMDAAALRDIGADSATVALEAERPFWKAPLSAWREAAEARRHSQRR